MVEGRSKSTSKKPRVESRGGVPQQDWTSCLVLCSTAFEMQATWYGLVMRG